MKKKQKYQSELLGVIYEDALAGYKIGAISEERMKHYEQECLVPEPLLTSFSAKETPPRHRTPISAHSAHS